MINPVIQAIFSTDQSVRPLETTANVRRRLGRLLIGSVALHIGAVMLLWAYPLIATAVGLRNIEIVDEDYNRAILIDFSQTLKYPAGYSGFRPPGDTADLEKLKKEEERRRRLAAERRAREKATRQEKETAAGAKSVAEKKAAEVVPTPLPSPTPKVAPFAKINSRPIKEQVQRLYEAKKAGRLVFNENKLKIGVGGRIMPDGSLAGYRLIVPSGNPEIDRAALAILNSVSESRALGPLHGLTSITMILEIDQRAELKAVGFVSSEDEAKSLVILANGFLLAAKLRNEDPSAQALLNNIRIGYVGKSIFATITMPRQAAADSLSKTMDKP